MTNCPNCGAVITGPKCEYCGTVFRPPSDNAMYVDWDQFALLKAETIRIRNECRTQELYLKALAAMRDYAG